MDFNNDTDKCSLLKFPFNLLTVILMPLIWWIFFNKKSVKSEIPLYFKDQPVAITLYTTYCRLHCFHLYFLGSPLLKTKSFLLHYSPQKKCYKFLLLHCKRKIVQFLLSYTQVKGYVTKLECRVTISKF
jgi:hypothetical protein